MLFQQPSHVVWWFYFYRRTFLINKFEIALLNSKKEGNIVTVLTFTKHFKRVLVNTKCK